MNQDSKKVLLACASLLALISIFVCGYFIVTAILDTYSGYRPPNAPKTETQSILDGADPTAILDGSELLFPEISTLPPTQPVRLVISTAPLFPSADAKGTLNIVNPSDNEGLLLQVRIIDPATDELLYLSPVLQPEQRIETDYLRKHDLSAGTYDATAIFDFYEQDGKSHFYSIAATVQIQIQQ